MGYHSPGMARIDLDAARDILGVPARFRVEAAAAFGRIGDPASLPETLLARETPSGWRRLSDTAFHGRFGG